MRSCRTGKCAAWEDSKGCFSQKCGQFPKLKLESIWGRATIVTIESSDRAETALLQPHLFQRRSHPLADNRSASTQLEGNRMRFIAAALALTLLTTTTTIAQEATQIITPPGAKKVGDVASYGLGFNIGANLAGGGITEADVMQADLLAGLLDALAGKEPAVKAEAVQAAMEALSKKIMDRKLAVSMKYLEENKKKDGIQVTESGLQYKVLKSGNGASPTATSTVTVHYEGKLTSGAIFDSSIRRGEPTTFGVSQVIPGWTEALLRMKVGDKWQLFIPPTLAYGERGAEGAIGPNETLIFEVELLEVK